MKMLSFSSLLLCIFLAVSCTDALAVRPIIGILSQNSYGSKHGASYITASYVKFIESAGAGVVPIFVNQTEKYYSKMFKSINGILFPGGVADIVHLSPVGYSGAAHILYKLAIQANKEGDFFPLWGTCLGFEELMILTAGMDVLKSGIDASNISLPVQLEPGCEGSRLLNKNTTPASIIKTLTTVNSTLNSHHLALTTANYTKFPALKSFYRVLSTNHDLNGIEFVSTVEAYDYPIYGTQWHPEKNAFEWKVNSCHTRECVELMQYMANFFVDEARKNQHHSVEEISDHLIYNYQPVNLSNTSSSFEQAYYFP